MTLELLGTISSQSQLRELMGQPVSDEVTAKTLPVLDHHCRAFIARAPFVLVATSDREGRMDISPKGDPPGFVRVLDDRTLAIPDRPGNQRFDSLRNLIDFPRIGLIFLIPGKSETLRISGSAKIVTDQALRDGMAVAGKVPALAIVVEVEEAFFHCGKAFVRSRLWQPDFWPSLKGLPTLAETMINAAKSRLSLREMRKAVKWDETERLY
jgi:PPOX class probable FMN-dependent enzyme